MTTHLTGPHCGGNGRGRRSLRRSCRPSSLSMTTQCDSKWHPSQQWNCWRLLITGVNPQRRRAAQTPACSLCRVTLIIMWQTAPRVSDVTAEPMNQWQKPCDLILLRRFRWVTFSSCAASDPTSKAQNGSSYILYDFLEHDIHKLLCVMFSMSLNVTQVE